MVEQIRSVAGEVSLLVVDADADEFYRQRDVVVTSAMPDVVAIETPLDPSAPQSSDTGQPRRFKKTLEIIFLNVKNVKTWKNREKNV